MKYLPRTVLAAARPAAAVCLALAAASVGCRPSSTRTTAADAAPPAGSAEPASFLTRRDPAIARPLPHPPAVADSAGLLPRASREPDWDLSSDDPALDYARRYAFFTRRYGDGFACVTFGASSQGGTARRVQVTTAASCPGAGAVRDVFLVDVASDHLTVDDPSRRDPLARWPDGSDPDGPPTTPVREIFRMQDWKSPLQDVVRRQMLVPIRVQAYGRGTYPVISIAGWHGFFQQDAPPDALRPLADALCAANGNMPLGVLMAMDRTRLLRVRCPAATRWDRL